MHISKNTNKYLFFFRIFVLFLSVYSLGLVVSLENISSNFPAFNLFLPQSIDIDGFKGGAAKSPGKIMKTFSIFETQMYTCVSDEIVETKKIYKRMVTSLGESSILKLGA